MAAAFPPTVPGSLQNVIPAYPYVEYADDDDVQAFFIALNTLTQQYVNWFNQINLPVYTGPLIVGTLLDWVLTGIYGIARPTIPLSTSSSIGEFDTYELDMIQFDQTVNMSPSTFTTLNDDFYQRVATWHLYIGDGKAFAVWWLKRRIKRFLTGVGGTDIVQQDTSSISVQVSAGVVTIAISASQSALIAAQTFGQCVAAGVLALPFQYSYVVNVS
jgi:hypothetical protein